MKKKVFDYSLSDLWEKVEKRVVYTSIFFYLFAQILSVFSKRTRFEFEISSEASISFVCLVLLFLLLFIDRRTGRLSGSHEPLAFNDLSTALSALSQMTPKIETIDILGHSTQAFFQHFRQKLDGHEKIRVVMRNHEVAQFLPHLSDNQAREYERSQIETTLNSWKNIISEEARPQSLFLSDDEPSIFMCLINGQNLLVGFYFQSEKDWGYSVKDCFVLSSQDIRSRQVISSHKKWFEDRMKHCSVAN